MDLSKFYEARKFMVDFLEKDLLGPGSDEEIIPESPLDYYQTGILYPINTNSHGEESESQDYDIDNPEADDMVDQIEHGAGSIDESHSSDDPIGMANAKQPNSLGISFMVYTSDIEKLRIRVQTAKYTENETGWIRNPINPPDISVNPRDGVNTENLSQGLELYLRVKSMDGYSTVTAVLINRNKSTYIDRAADSFLQPKIVIKSVNEGENIFVDRGYDKSSMTDSDIASYELLYRHVRIFSIGHGCSGSWESEEGSTMAKEISTEVIPKFALKLTGSNDSIDSADNKYLDIDFLATADKFDIIDALNDLVDQYEEWKDSLTFEINEWNADDNLAKTAYRHIGNIEEAIKRMRAGIAVLNQDKDVLNAFRLANQAIKTSMARSSGTYDSSSAESLDYKPKWYPFQIAFILLSIESIANPENSEHRDVLDLLWFPTGGGKTEAYFGVISFTIFLRRLRKKDKGGGTTAFMRYSLRLLTIQQMERAARIICACEYIRSGRSDLGSAPISLGLFIGGSMTPNSHSGGRNSIGTDQALTMLSEGSSLPTHNPVQIKSCPWCRKTLDYNNYKVSKDEHASHATRVLNIYCSDDECVFGLKGEIGKLPIFLVDEDLYNYRPTFVIGTVDKFANLPWNEEVGDLFNIGHDDPAPELIIQDELHLMSGPLGTIAGLYETAIDILCQQNGYRPKVIASTATVRNASEQCMSLFARNSFQFPPPGLDSRNSYFSVESSSDEKGNRLYLGLFSAGSSQTRAMVRMYAALLQGAEVIRNREDVDDEVKDAYWTLVGYFNTRRLMSSANIQVIDDVNVEIKRIANLAKTNPRGAGIGEDSIIEPKELYGGTDPTDLRNTLDRLEDGFDKADCIDVLLATSMISVGVDINRWGLMAVMGQPITTSEYIQATSRVGRQYPGLVAVILNHSKSRDRSHYESFKAYHSLLYRQVESTSLTPFSGQARKRALHAIHVGLMRQLYREFKENDAVNVIDSDEGYTAVREIAKKIIDRAKKVSSPDIAESTEKEIYDFIDHWKELSQTGKLGHYNSSVRGQETIPLLIQAGGRRSNRDSYETMTSMRDVDTESGLYLHL